MTTFVFVHGRGQHGRDLTDWRQPIVDHLTAGGVTPPALDSDHWVELRYDDLFDDDLEGQGLVWPDRRSVPADAAAAYGHRNAGLRELVLKAPQLGPFAVLNKSIDAIVGWVLGKYPIPDLDLQGIVVRYMKDVTAFANDEELRLAVVHRLLAGMPSGEVVLVAHSLGTVAVLEMLPYLPADTSVRLLLTLGSPAALVQLREKTNLAGADAPFPFDRVDRWLNLVNPGDPVSLGAGLEGVFRAVIDHRVATTVSRTWEKFHGVRTYLEDPILSEVMRLTLYRGQTPVLYASAAAGGGGAALLPSHVSVLYASQLAESAALAKHRKRARRILNEKLLPALCQVEERDVRLHDIDLHVGAWVAEGQPRSHRLMVLLHAATSDPLAPFEPGLTDDDRAAGLRQLAQRLGLSGADAEDVLALLEACYQVARNEKRKSPWKKVLVGVGLAASVAVAAPVALGAFAAAGATGAAAMTSGLAALGVGGMGGGLSTLAALAAGIGVVGGQLAGATPASLLQDETAMTQELAQRAAMVRLLRGVDEDHAQEASRRGLDGLRQIHEELEALVEDHRELSSSESDARKAAEHNLERVEVVRKWLDLRTSVDRHRAGRDAPAALPERTDNGSTTVHGGGSERAEAFSSSFLEERD